MNNRKILKMTYHIGIEGIMAIQTGYFLGYPIMRVDKVQVK